MLTIGQLARYTGVSAKTIRFYHSAGVLPQPNRDTSGYRRYSATDAMTLLRVRTLAEAGVPLARVRALLDSTPVELAGVLAEVDRDLSARIAQLKVSRARLRRLVDPDSTVPPGVADYLRLLERIGLSEEWITMERDLWLLAFATHPESAAAMLADQHQAKTEPLVQQIYLDYDRARALDPDSPELAELARRIVQQTLIRYPDRPPAPPAGSPIPALIQDMVNGTSPAWRRLDRYVRDGLRDTRPVPGRISQ